MKVIILIASITLIAQCATGALHVRSSPKGRTSQGKVVPCTHSADCEYHIRADPTSNETSPTTTTTPQTTPDGKWTINVEVRYITHKSDGIPKTIEDDIKEIISQHFAQYGKVKNIKIKKLTTNEYASFRVDLEITPNGTNVELIHDILKDYLLNQHNISVEIIEGGGFTPSEYLKDTSNTTTIVAVVLSILGLAAVGYFRHKICETCKPANKKRYQVFNESR